MSVFEKINRVLKEWHLCALILIIGAITNTVAMIFYLPQNPSFSFLTNYNSDVGAGPVETKVAIVIGSTLNGLVTLLLVIFIKRNLEMEKENSKIIRYLFVAGVVESVSLILLGFFPLDHAIPIAYEVHKIVAIFYFAALGVFMLVYGFLEYSSHDNSKRLAFLSIITGIFAFIFVIGFTIQEYTGVSRQTFVFLMEWFALYTYTFWLIFHGIFFYKKGKINQK